MGFPGQRDSARSAVNPHNEDALQRHHAALRHYLAASLQDELGIKKPNRARDKLLRLSVTQFMELSTDVYDELIRREDERMQRVRDVPRSLPPKQNFHPKRNQARQKLSTLPIERFRQLATDVFYELERRIPRFAGPDFDRPMSGGSSRGSSRVGVRQPRGSIRPPPPGTGSMSPGGANGLGSQRPLPKQFQSNTMVPNKSTMVEDDEDGEDDGDDYGMDNVVAGLARRDTNVDGSSEEDQQKLRAREAEIADLQDRLSEKEQEYQRAKSAEQDGFNSLRQELERKHADAQKLNDSLRRELDQLHQDKAQDEREIRAQHDRSTGDLRNQLHNAQIQVDELHHQLEGHEAESEDLRNQVDNARNQADELHHQLEAHAAETEELRYQLGQRPQHSTSNNEYERRIDLLRQELANQEKITKEVREEAAMLLQEMRDLSKQNDVAVEQEEKLASQVSKLQKDNNNWRQRYAKLKAQNKGLRASMMGLSLQTSFDVGSISRTEGMLSESGLVKDVDVTHFQLSIEELLKVSRQSDTAAMLDTVKNVVVCVQSITSAVSDVNGYPTPSASPHGPEDGLPRPMGVSKLKARVTGTANSLITQTKLHASACGLSPIALLDAAASNLTAAVVELVKTVGIRPTPSDELQDDEPDHVDSFYADDHNNRSPSNDEDEAALSPPPLTVQVVAPSESKPMPSPTRPSLGRSNTFKKMNDWFGWGSKATTPAEEMPPPTPTANGVPPTPTLATTTTNGVVGEEYDPYHR